MRRLMISGTSSGCGKTTLTCGILRALLDRGVKVSAFKCGPDYIDPMFHTEVTGAKCRNLDGVFHSPGVMACLLQKNAGDLALLEGAMGYYDGIGDSGRGSCRRTALDTRTPAVLVVDCKGMGQSMGAVMKGFLTYREPSGVAGFLFNRLPESMADAAKALCRELGTAYLGRFPTCPQYQLGSRHLGLVTAREVEGLEEKIAGLGRLAAEHVDLDALLELAGTAGELSAPAELFPTGFKAEIPIGIARDKAFCFYYEDDLDLLRALGCRLAAFSPLEDRTLPEGICGLLLGGGYPELYARRLSENEAMRESIRRAVAGGLPTLAECGGFLYLHQSLEDSESRAWPMAGAIDGRAYRTGRLQRFGYVELTAREDSLLCRRGDRLKGHEFHYWDSTACGEGFTAKKLRTGQKYPCGWAGASLYAGFPHLNLCGNPEAAGRFVEKCRAFRPNP